MTLSARLNLLAGATVLATCLGVGLALAQPEPAPTQQSAPSQPPAGSAPANTPATTPDTTAASATTGTTAAPEASTEAPTVPPAAPAAPPAAVALDDTASKAALAVAREARTAGNDALAVEKWREVLQVAPAGPQGDMDAMEASRMLGYTALEQRDPRSAETYFAAEAILARRLFMSGLLSARRLTDAVGRWAGAAGAMGRSTESDALVRYGWVIRDRTQAAASESILNREASTEQSGSTDVRVESNSGVCVTEREPLLRTRVTCEDEAGALTEAMSLRASQLRAPADREAVDRREAAERARKNKKGGGGD